MIYTRPLIKCDICEAAVGLWNNKDGEIEARKIARSEGWRRVHGKDICPSCVTKER